MPKAEQLKAIGARVFYRDRSAGRYDYVEGKVTAYKSVRDAEKDWDQKWSHQRGTILEIEPTGKVDEQRTKYRHLSSVLTPQQYRARIRKRRREGKN